MSTLEESPLAQLRRWEDFGATWRVDAVTAAGLTITLCRCDGGEEVARIVSADPALAAYVEGRDSGP